MTSSTQQPHPAGTSLSHFRNTGRSLRLMSIILVLVFVAASTGLVVMAIRLNAHAAAQSGFYVKKVLEARQRQIDTTLADYAFWGDAYKHLHMQLDLVWAYERRNLGPSLYENFGLEGVFLVAPDGDTVYAVVEGELSRLDVHQWAGGQLDGLIEHARQTVDQEEVLSGFLEIGSQPALIALAAMTHDNDPAVLPIAGPPSVLVFVDFLLPAKLSHLGKEYGIEGLRTGEHAGTASLPKPTLFGHELILTWDPPRPGDALLLVLLPLLLLASIILVVVTRATLRSSVNAARAIDAGYLAAQAYQAQLTFHAQHDPLTGLPNRSLLHERLVTAQHRILTESLEVTVMLLDLDGFKPINDTYGHHVGDKVLVEVAERLQRLAAPGDTVARLGGDEFVLLVLGSAEPSQIEDFAARVLEAVSRPYVVDGHEFHITASAGLACNNSDVDQVQRLVQMADLAMYAAKADGRNTCQWYAPSLDHTASEKLRLRNDLQEALDGGQLELYYQPKICARSLRVLGVEALLRWRHPRRGLVSPGDFIPLAEETGQIIPISRWVLDVACRDLRQLALEGYPDLTMAVNISSLHLMRRDFIDDVQQSLTLHGVAPSRLELEITESLLLRQMGRATVTLEVLRRLGVLIAIDDFGTGFSNLGYLRKLPVQKIKIDGSFTAEIETSRADAAIVQGILWLAHTLGLRVVAEGVETAAQRDFLASNRCDEFQGYFFARPMPLGQLRAYLAEQQSQQPGLSRSAALPAE